MEVHGNVTINNLIEKQEITVESGGVLNFGTPQVENEEAASEVEGLTVEDEEMLLPLFKGDRKMLRQFFAEVQGAAPEQVTAKMNAWIGDGRIAKKFNMKNFWETLYKKGIYPYSYEAMNKHVIR